MDGVRHSGSVTIVQACVWNVGTCRPDDKGEFQVPTSKLLEAFSYVIHHWGGLTVHLEHGIVPISNVVIEQQIRNLKLGAKNWLFAASEVGADTVAIFNSLVCTCKMNRINILEYLTDVLGSLGSKSASALTPLAWEAARKQNPINL